MNQFQVPISLTKYEYGDRVATLDGGIGYFLGYKMDRNFVQIEFADGQVEVYHVDQIRKW